LKAVNLVYSEVLKDARYLAVEKKHLNAAREKHRGVTRMVPLLQLLWGDHENWGSFDKTLVCKKICELAVADEAFLANGTVERFQNVFDRVQKGISGQVDTEKTATAVEVAAAEEGQASPRKKKT
jgi:hypothetical protein